MKVRDSPFSLLPIMGRYVNRACMEYSCSFYDKFKIKRSMFYD